MAIIIEKSVFHDIDGTLFSLPNGADVHWKENTVLNARNGPTVLVRDPASLFSLLGLREDTPPEIVRELLTKVLAEESPTSIFVDETARSVKALDWLAAGANYTTLIGGIQALAQNNYLQAALALLT